MHVTIQFPVKENYPQNQVSKHMLRSAVKLLTSSETLITLVNFKSQFALADSPQKEVSIGALLAWQSEIKVPLSIICQYDSKF